MEENRICSFFGHREITLTEDLYRATVAEIRKTLENGCRIFYFGGYGEFDDLCYKIISELNEERPELGIKRVYCAPMESYLRKRVRYFDPEKFDEVIYLPPKIEWWYKSIYYRNQAMIDKSDCIIFYARENPQSGAYKAYKYAVGKKQKTVINLADRLV